MRDGGREKDARAPLPALAPPEGFVAVAALGQGAFSCTFLVGTTADATAPGAARVCKRMTRRAIDDPDACAAFEREGRVLAALEGRGAPRLVASGTDGHGPWLLLERAPEGYATIADLVAVAREPALDRATRVRVAAAAVAALDAVHAATDARGPLRVVHGDVGPANVLAGAGGACLVDFGLASWRDDRSPAVGGGGAFRGTLAYAAPEVARGEPFDERADRFALAATLGHLLTGRPPRPLDLAAPALLAHAGETPIDDAFVRDVATAAGGELGERLARWLAFAPSAR